MLIDDSVNELSYTLLSHGRACTFQAGNILLIAGPGPPRCGAISVKTRIHGRFLWGSYPIVAHGNSGRVAQANTSEDMFRGDIQRLVLGAQTLRLLHASQAWDDPIERPLEYL